MRSFIFKTISKFVTDNSEYGSADARCNILGTFSAGEMQFPPSRGSYHYHQPLHLRPGAHQKDEFLNEARDAGALAELARRLVPGGGRLQVQGAVHRPAETHAPWLAAVITHSPTTVINNAGVRDKYLLQK